MNSPFFRAGLLLLVFAPTLRAITFTNLHSFAVFTNGAQPVAPLVRASDGAFYGTTSAGGTNGGFGTVFKMTTNGVVTSLHSFNGSADGSSPESGLMIGHDGNFYATTRSGGSNDAGTVFKITTNGVLTTLVQFSGVSQGGDPSGGLVLASDGNFYGTTQSGGSGNGTVFRMTPAGALTTLYTFNGTTDGDSPAAALIQGNDGYLYGTTIYGGNFGRGTIFQISTNGSLTTLYSFGLSMNNSVALDGDGPAAPLIQGADGNFYGTTQYGGSQDDGTVFQITPTGTLTTLYSFGSILDVNQNALDGSAPLGGLVVGNDGNFYGTTSSGGTRDLIDGGGGTVFSISSSGTLTTLYSFGRGGDGAFPDAGLLLANGFFYGTASQGPINVNGTLFKITAGGTFSALYGFPGGQDGANPSAELAQDKSGNFYGTTEDGGETGDGTLFKITPGGALTVLVQFHGTNGTLPEGQLLLAPDGFLYGTTSGGGAYDSGTIFRISTNGVFTLLYSFGVVNNSNGGPLDGGTPWAGLILGPDGNLYGTTSDGGANDNGTIFQITTNGAFTSLYSFSGGDGSAPYAPLLLGPDGYFYGTTVSGGGGNGTVFKVDTNGNLATLYPFGGGADSSSPYGGLIFGADQNLYGTTYGNLNNDGTIFKITTNGNLTTLVSFTGPNGSSPQAGLVRAADGNFYGTTVSGGVNDEGVLFQLKPDGTFTVIRSFARVTDGSEPDCGLIQGLDGNLYGLAEYGGGGGNGSFYELIIAAPPPRFLSVTRTNSLTFLAWSAVAGRNYQLQFSTNISPAGWSSLGSPVLATNSTAFGSDSALDRRRFYRVALLP